MHERKGKRMAPVAGIIGFLSFSIIATTPLCAETPSTWKGNLELSYLETSGNTDSQTLSVAGKVEGAFNRSKITGEAKVLYGEKEEVTTGKSWFTSLKYDWSVSQRMFLFLLESVDRNVLKGIEFRYVHQGGLGYYFIKADKAALQGEAGAGYTHEDPVDPFKDRGFPTGRLFLGYVHSFTEASRFEQTVEYLPNLKKSEDYLINEETALITNLMGNLALKVSFAVTFDHLPPPDFEKSDRVFKTAFLYTF